MLALGSPLHAFDFTTLAERRIVVRRAAASERLRTLDGTERELVPDDLVIADAEHAVALAGIMGGEETEIGDGTTTVLLEAANFEPHDDLSQLGAAPAPDGELQPLGEGRRPVPRRPVGRARDRAPARARRRHLDREQRRPRRAAGAAAGAVPPRARGRADRRRDPARAAVRDPGAPRLRASRRRRRRPHLARARRRPRGRRDRGDRALPTRARAVHAAAPARDVRRLSPETRSCAAASRTPWSASGSPRSTRRACVPTTTRRGGCPSRSRSS